MKRRIKILVAGGGRLSLCSESRRQDSSATKKRRHGEVATIYPDGSVWFVFKVPLAHSREDSTGKRHNESRPATRSSAPIPSRACRPEIMPNGRCRMHRGKSPGAPKGNRHAFKHGRYTAEAIAGRRGIAALLQTMSLAGNNDGRNRFSGTTRFGLAVTGYVGSQESARKCTSLLRAEG
jgi:hypothetical protein